MKILLLFVIFFLPNYTFSETVKLIDGRTIKLNADGTYKFIESVNRIQITASKCKNESSISEKKDDFNKIVGYKYFTGFSLQYKITNQTQFPLVVRQLGTEFSKDYGMFYTLLKIPTFAGPINSGKSLILNRNSHLYYTLSEVKLSLEEINKLFNKHGCSNKNLTGQKIFIDTGHTKLKLPPEAGNLDPLTLLNVSSKIQGLEAVVR